VSYVVDGWVNVDVLGKVNKFCQPIPGKVFVKKGRCSDAKSC